LSLYRARLKLPQNLQEPDLALLAEGFTDIAMAHVAMREENVSSSPWNLELILEEAPTAEDLTARTHLQCSLMGKDIEEIHWHIEDVPETNWLEHSYQQFPPFSVGPFFIYGSHFEGSIPEQQIGLQIDAATAFGSGEHPTTKGCLQAMLDLKSMGQCPWNVLDMGTGSGILAIAAWKLWKTPIFAVDNDPESIRVTEHHLNINGVKIGKTSVSTLVNEGFEGETVQKRGPYDLVIANILAGPLVSMAADLAAVCDERGYVILSGLLTEQAETILEAYHSEGLTQKKAIEIGEWTTLVLQKA